MQKYLLQQPKTLETLAIARVADWVTIQGEELLLPIAKLQERYPTKVEELLSRRIKCIQKRVQYHMSYLYYNKLASEIMKKIPKLLKKINLLLPRQITNSNVSEHNIYVCDPIGAYNVVSRVIEITFTKKLTCLLFEDPESRADDRLFEYNTWDIFKSSFCSKSHLLSGLVRLEIQSCSKEMDIIKLLKELHNLKYLSLSIATYIVLKCVEDNCQLIEQLEVDYEEEFTDHSIDILTRLRNLKHVKFNAKTVAKKGITKLLLRCENIESIDVFHITGMIESALEDIDSGEDHVDKQLKLTSFRGSYKTTAEQLRLVVKMCPRLQTVKLSANYTSHDCLLHFRHCDLTYLRNLTIYDSDFYSDGVKEVLEAKGAGLVKLNLHYNRQIDSNALACIYRTCPNLQRLYIHSCSMEKENLHVGSSTGEERIKPLKYLKKLKLTRFYPVPSNDQLIFLLSNCPNVEFVDICEEHMPMDEIIFHVINGKNWMHLKRLQLYKTKLSKYVIDLLVQNCLNRPEVITYYVNK